MRTLRPALLASVVALSACMAEEPVDGTIEELAPCPGAHTMSGLDVSVWQGHIDWHSVARSKSFGIARAAYGTSVDSTFAYNYRSMHAEGMIRGSYQFFVPTEDGAAQADVLLRQIGTLGPGDLPPMLDVESDPSHAFPPVAVTTSRIRAWKERIEARTGRHPLIYTGAYFWPSHVTASADFAEMGLVIPAWGPTCPTIMAPWHDWVMHQYTSSGSVSGISGRVDLDLFKGDRTALESLAGIHHCAVHCSASGDIVEADCSTHVCAGTSMCSTAGSTAPHCATPPPPPAPDAGTAVHDAGTAAHDAGTAAHDAGTAAHDAGTAAHDGGVPRTGDAGPYALAPIDYPPLPAGSLYGPGSTRITGGCSVAPPHGGIPGSLLLVGLGLAALVVRRRTRD